MEWLVQIKGDLYDLKVLSKFFNSPELCIMQERKTFLMKSTNLNSLKKANDVRKNACKIISLINGAGLPIRVRPLLEVGKIYRVLENGKREACTTSSSSMSDGMLLDGNVYVEVVKSTGSVQKVQLGNLIQKWVKIAQHDQNVDRVLSFLGTDNLDWKNLYCIFEVIESDVGGISKITSNGWAPKKSIKLFTQTAQSYDAIGIEARHGKHIIPPRSPHATLHSKVSYQNTFP